MHRGRGQPDELLQGPQANPGDEEARRDQQPEYEADVVCREAIADLFEKTQKVEQLKDLIKLKEIYGRLEIAADRCEDVANIIEGIIVKTS